MKNIVAGCAAIVAVLISSTSAFAINCVAYVRAATDFDLMGDAWQWWYAANGKYQRGYTPAPGAVMVFSRTGRMHVGHVAVVRQILGPREILIDQANWHRGRVDHAVGVIDTSANNDWSRVTVQWEGSLYGGTFPITGFVYAPGMAPPNERYQVPSFNPEREPRVIQATARSHTGHLILTGGRALARHSATLHLAVAHQPKAHAVLANCAKPKAKPAHAAPALRIHAPAHVKQMAAR